MIGFALLTVYMLFAAGKLSQLLIQTPADRDSLPGGTRYTRRHGAGYHSRHGLWRSDLPKHRAVASRNVRTIYHRFVTSTGALAHGLVEITHRRDHCLLTDFSHLLFAVLAAGAIVYQRLEVSSCRRGVLTQADHVASMLSRTSTMS